MNLLYYVYLILIGFGAGFVQRVSGFGLGIFAMIFLPHFMPSHNAAVFISTLFSLATTTYNAVRYRKNIAYKIALPMVLAALITTSIAVYFSAVVSGNIFKILLGIVLIGLSVYFIFFNKHIKIKPNLKNGIIAGSLSGALGGLFSTGGPPAVLYLNNATSDKRVYFATIQFHFCLNNIYATTLRAANGIINTEILLFAAIGIIGCMSGDFIGKRIFDKLDSAKLKLVIYIGMIISGILMLF